MELTKEQWLKLGGGVIAVLKKHGADTAELLSDVPKAISLAKDMAEMLSVVQGAAPVPANLPPITQTELFKNTAPVQLVPAKVSANSVITHVKIHGVTDSDRAVVERASQGFG